MKAEREAALLKAFNTRCKAVDDAVREALRFAYGEIKSAELAPTREELAQSRDLLERTRDALNEAWQRRLERLARVEATRDEARGRDR